MYGKFELIKKFDIHKYKFSDIVNCLPTTCTNVILDLSYNITEQYIIFVNEILLRHTPFIKFLSIDSNELSYFEFCIFRVDNIIVNVMNNKFLDVIELLKSRDYYNKVIIIFWDKNMTGLKKLSSIHINELYVMSIYSFPITYDILDLLETSEQLLLEFGIMKIDGNYIPLCEEYTKMISKYDDLSIFVLLEKVLYGYMPTIVSFI
jgi:hypothetical protein